MIRKGFLSDTRWENFPIKKKRKLEDAAGSWTSSSYEEGRDLSLSLSLGLRNAPPHSVTNVSA